MQDVEEGGIALAQLARAWIEAEHLKREMRGLPRLSTHSLRELTEAKRAAMKSITTNATAYEEIHDEPTKESINPKTVTTPPAPDCPSAPVVGNDK